MTGTTGMRRTRPGGWVWLLAKLGVRTFYRIERIGEPLPDGALLLVANHPQHAAGPRADPGHRRPPGPASWPSPRCSPAIR